MTTNAITQTRAHNRQNEIGSATGQTSPTYDANGNQTRDFAGRAFTYDAWNRVKTGAGHTYELDGLGRRIEDTAGGVTTDSYHTAAWQVVEERVNNTSRRQYVWSPVYVDALVLRDRDADGNGSLEERLWGAQDANYNVTAVFDNAGNVVERYAYDPYGTPAVYDAGYNTRASSNYGWDRLFQGLVWDPATGKYHARHRDYDPAQGRWTSNDPLGFGAGDVNFYRFVGNGPVSGLDPSGLDPTIGMRGAERLMTSGPNREAMDLADEMTGRATLGIAKILFGAGAVRCGIAPGVVVMDDGLADVRNSLRVGTGQPKVDSITVQFLREQGFREHEIEGVQTYAGLKSLPGLKGTGARGAAKPTNVDCRTGRPISRLSGFKDRWVNPDGSIRWPENNGFAGPPEKATIGPGTRIDRYGYEGGTFVSPEGTPAPQRSLAPGTEAKPYHVYEVVKPIEVESGKIAPWFDQPGGGTQYKLGKSIRELLDEGSIREVPK